MFLEIEEKVRFSIWQSKLVLATVPNSGSVPDSVPTRNWHVAMGLTTWKPGQLQLGRFYYHQPGISTSQVWRQLSIGVLNVSWHDRYINRAVSCAVSSPAFRFAIRPMFGESRSKTCEFQSKITLISQPLNEYELYSKYESWRWKNIQNCTIYILIMSW
jgi:hypothetical protein